MRKAIITLTALMGSWLMACAVPAYPHPLQVVQPDGSIATICLHGDEHGYSVTTLSGQPLRRNASTGFYEPCTQEKAFVRGIPRHAAPSAVNRSPRKILINDFPAFGEQRILVLLVEFSDVKFTTIDQPHDYYDRLLNEEGFTHDNGAHGSARDYYIASSMGQFAPHFDVVGPITLPHSREYYGGDSDEQLDARAWEMVTDACRLADETTDFSKYDANGDGIVDNVYIFYAGYGQADSGISDAIWPHAARLIDDWHQEELVADGVTLNRYATSNEIRYGTNPAMPVGIGVFVHEFGHVLGFADHYDTRGTSGRVGVQDWDTMASACYHDNQNTPPLLSAFERAEVGWLQPTDMAHTEQGLISLPPLADRNQALRIDVPGTAGREYFILENRQQQGWDAFLPGHGMLVWHVDMDEDAWRANEVNTLADHQRLDIVEADGTEAIASYKGDPFPGAEKISVHDFHDWSGNILFGFEYVEESDTAVSFLLARTGYKPAMPAMTVDNIHGTMFSVSWTAVADARQYLLSVSEQQADGSTAIVEGYDRKAYSQAGTVTIEGLSPQHTYTVDLLAAVGGCESEVATAVVATGLEEFFEKRPTSLPATDISDSGFTAHWAPMDEADDYSITLYRHTLSPETAETYDFTDKEAGMPSGWSATSTTYNRALFGQKAPSLQLEKDGDCLLLNYSGHLVKSLTFWHRSQSRNNRLVVEGFTDGEWHEVDAFAAQTKGTTTTVEAGGCEQLRLRLERKSGYVVVDDVEAIYVTPGREAIENCADIATGGSLHYTFTGLKADHEYGYAVKGTCQGVASRESAEVTVRLNGTSNSIAAPQNMASYSATYDLQGRRQTTGMSRGISIVRHADGTSTKHVR